MSSSVGSAKAGDGVRTLVTGGAGFIGAHLIEALLHSGRELLVLGLGEPQHPDHTARFQRADVRDLPALRKRFGEFAPTEVVHLAARTDFVDRPDAAGYEVNTRGTANVIQAVAECAAVERCVFASSNVVFRDGRHPSTGAEYKPAYLYGESKALAERLVEEDSSMRCSWCIVRPCYVWGPGFGTPYRDFFMAVARGRYVHLGAADAPKLLGYVGNVVHQLIALLDAAADRIHRGTFYLADDEPTTIREWADEIARQLDVRRPFSMPIPVAKLAARAGDLLQGLGYRNPPLTSRRLANMSMDTTAIPIQATREIAGPAPFDLERGVELTIRWMKRHGHLA